MKGDMKMVIDKEFAELIPPLTSEEYKRLERSILADGCRDALVVWGDTLVDGHNRYHICTEHNIPYTTVNKEFDDRNKDIKYKETPTSQGYIFPLEYVERKCLCAKHIVFTGDDKN